ncbi:NAD(+) hydrolase sarm1-like [Oppia nitens]|uniref:NAD(+) hydrolase sarm1-like n=1 Tax=Oppia nitens TaxID=1686743 RepID=UPI0023DA2535|nr:NAD(+) hydrolase sarm1-like [Oppia nitens]
MKSINSTNATNFEKSSDFFKHQLSSFSENISNKKSQILSQTSSERKSSIDFDRHNLGTNNCSDSLPIVCTSPNDSDNDESASSTSASLIPASVSSGVQRSSKYEHRMKTEASKLKLMGDGFKAQKTTASNQELRRLQSNDTSFEERSSLSALKSKLEGNGFSASKMAAIRQDQKQMQFGDTLHTHQSTAKASSLNFCTDDSIAQKKTYESQKEERMVSAHGLIQNQKSSSHSSSSRFMSSSNLASNNLQFLNHNAIDSSAQPLIEEPFSPTMLSLANEMDLEFDVLSSAAAATTNSSLNRSNSTTNYIGNYDESPDMKGSMDKLERKMSNLVEKFNLNRDSVEILTVMTDMIRKAWSVPQCGYDLGFNMSKIIREGGALEILIKNCEPGVDYEIQFLSAQLLEQCLTAENRDYVCKTQNGLSDVVNIACKCVDMNSIEETRVGTGLLEHLFKHSEDVCKEVIALGGLDSILFECRSTDITTLRHCASALANLSLYGGPDNQLTMIQSKVPVWLFPLAFHYDDNIKYYACLAIAVLVANKEVEAAVLKSGTLNLVEPFISSHNPKDFAQSCTSHIHGQSKNWLKRLVPVLNSNREEARSLAAFHFAMEAWIKKTQEKTSVFREIGCIEALKTVAGCPNAIASKYAAQALSLIGEEIPHKLSQQVPLWTSEDVKEWVKQIGFCQFVNEFIVSRVDGDLLLQLSEDMLRDDIGIKNGILRKRFLRELEKLQRISDYSSCDSTNLNSVLNSLGQEFSRYTYSLIQSGVDHNTLRFLDEDILQNECKVNNSIHRMKIMQTIRGINEIIPANEVKDMNDRVDIFVSYRRSNGSQLASLLKVHLQLRGFSVFIDVERLEAGKFDNNLLSSIRQAKYFLLVLTPNALDRCVNDVECKDWIHKEVVEALKSECNIIPILDSFQWPDAEALPEDMRAVCYFNAVRWIHDYQDACVDKLERFMRGETNKLDMSAQLRLNNNNNTTMAVPPTPSTPSIASKPPAYHRSGSFDSGSGKCSE